MNNITTIPIYTDYSFNRYVLCPCPGLPKHSLDECVACDNHECNRPDEVVCGGNKS